MGPISHMLAQLWKWIHSPEAEAFSTVTGLTLVTIIGWIVKYLYTRRKRDRLSASGPPAVLNRVKAERDYLAHFLDDMSQYWDPSRYVKLEGEIRQQTTLFWLPLLFVKDRSRVQGLDLPDRIHGTRMFRARDLLAEVQRLSRVVVLGEPGAGKTIMLRQIGIGIARRSQSQPGFDFLLPVYLSLGEYTEHQNGQPSPVIEFVRQKLQQTQGEGHYGRTLAIRLNEYLDAGRLVMLFDALDEMPRSDYIDRFRELIEFMDAHPGNVYVFSCRVNDFVDLTEFRVNQAIVRPLSRAQIRRFLNSYVGRPIARRVSHILFSPDSPFLNHASNPFFLTILALSFAELGSVPTTWDAVLRQYIDTALRFHVPSGASPAGLIEQTRRFLSRLAYEVTEMSGSGTAIPLDFLRNVEPSKTQLERLLEHARSSGLLRSTSESTVKFAHHRVQEYLAAIELARRIDEGGQDLSELANSFWWQEILRMAAGLTARPDDLVRQISGNQGRIPFAPGGSERREAFNRTILSISCAHTAAFKLSSRTLGRMTDNLIDYLRNGTNVEKVKALRMTTLYSDPIVWDEVNRLARDKSPWVRTVALESIAGASRMRGALKGLARSRFWGLASGGLSPFENWRDVFLLLANRTTIVDGLWLALGLAIGICRKLWVALAVCAAGLFLNRIGLLSSAALVLVGRDLLWVSLFYLFADRVLVRMLQWNMNSWFDRLLNTYNRFLAAYLGVILTIRLGIYGLNQFVTSTATGTKQPLLSWRSVAANSIYLTIFLIWAYFFFKSIPAWGKMLGDLLAFGDRWKGMRYLSSRTGGGTAGRLIEMASEEPSPVLRAELIRRLMDLTTLDVSVLDSLEALEKDETDRRVQDVIGQVYIELETRLRQMKG